MGGRFQLFRTVFLPEVRVPEVEVVLAEAVVDPVVDLFPGCHLVGDVVRLIILFVIRMSIVRVAVVGSWVVVGSLDVLVGHILSIEGIVVHPLLSQSIV